MKSKWRRFNETTRRRAREARALAPRPAGFARELRRAGEAVDLGLVDPFGRHWIDRRSS